MKNAYILSLITVIAMTVILLMPQLKMPWSLIDDGEDLRMSQEIAQHLSDGDYTWLLGYEKVNGRFRPMYWLWHFANYKVFGLSAFGHHLSHLILYIAISVLIFLITHKISKSNLGGVFAVILFLFFVPSAENFYRLGTAEPKIVLLYLIIVWQIVKLYFEQFTRGKPSVGLGNYLLVLFSVGVAYFTKETTPILIAAFFFLFVGGLLDPNLKNKKAWLKFSAVFLFFNLLFLVSSYLIRQRFYENASGTYIQAYEFIFLDIIKRFYAYSKLLLINYNLVLLIPVVGFAFTLKELLASLTKVKGRELVCGKLSAVFLWQAALLSWFFLYLLIQIPWSYVLGRYLMPMAVWFSIFMGIEYAKHFSKESGFLLNFAKGKLTFKLPGISLFSLVVIFIFLSYGSWQIYKMYYSVVKGERATQRMIRYLAEEIPPQGKLYVNFSDVLLEYAYEIPLHLSLFYDRPDIKVEYLSLEHTETKPIGSMVISFKENFTLYPWAEVKSSSKNMKEIDKSEFGKDWKILKLDEKSVSENLLQEEK